MAKSKKELRRERRQKREQKAAAEVDPATRRRAADATTVAWMLSLLATLIAELLALAGVILVAIVPQKEESPGLLNMIPGSLGFTALVTGGVCLVLTPIVRRLRGAPSPLAIEITAVVAGGIPWLLVAVSLMAKLAR